MKGFLTKDVKRRVLIVDDEPIICELNSNPQFASTLQYTGVNLAEVIADYILNNL